MKIKLINLLNNLKMKWQHRKREKMSPMFVLLVAISTATMLISNIIAVKNWPFFGLSINGNELTLPAAVIVFPITYILSDVYSEVYGYSWSRKTAWISFGLNLFMIGVFQLAILLPYPAWWGGQEAMVSILGSAPGTLFAGLIAYMIGDFFNDLVFKKLKEKHKDKKFGLRAILSSFVGEICDSSIFMPLLYLFTNQYGTTITAWYQVIVIILLQASIKTLYEVIICPLTYIITKKLKKYELNLNEILKG